MNKLIVEQGSRNVRIEFQTDAIKISDRLRGLAEAALLERKAESGYYDLTLYAGTTELDFETNIL